jgi:hypothetical protein
LLKFLLSEAVCLFRFSCKGFFLFLSDCRLEEEEKEASQRCSKDILPSYWLRVLKLEFGEGFLEVIFFLQGVAYTTADTTMGNYICIGANAGDQVQDEWSQLPPVKVVKPDGGIQVFKRSVTVLELIKLHPDHFVCHSKALTTNVTSKSVLPKDVVLEAGRLYYILANSKLQDYQQAEPNSCNLELHMNLVTGITVRELPFKIKLHNCKSSRQQQLPGFAQLMMRAGQDIMARVLFDPDRKQQASESAGHIGDEPPPMISYSTPDLGSMYLNGPKKSLQLTRSNSWKPRLETISEVSAYSRIQKLLVRGRSQKGSSQVHSSY